jgi:hypothetical protein
MQIKSGTAKVLSANHRRVQVSGMTAADAALLATPLQFQFQGETGLYFTVASVISVVSPEVELTADYNGANPFDGFFAYELWRDFTPTRGLRLFGANDSDLRDGLNYNSSIIDPLLGGGGGSGLFASGVASVTTDAVSKTVTGTFPAGGAYVVLVTPNWLTSYRVRPGSKSTTQFIVDFGVPAPASADLSWGVVA